MISNTIYDLEQSVQQADNKFDTINQKLTDFERNIGTVLTDEKTEGDGVDTECVMELLDTMTEVKNEYQNLRKDLQEVQQLQREMTDSLRYQMRSMRSTFQILKKRIQINQIENASLGNPNNSNANLTVSNAFPKNNTKSY